MLSLLITTKLSQWGHWRPLQLQARCLAAPPLCAFSSENWCLPTGKRAGVSQGGPRSGGPGQEAAGAAEPVAAPHPHHGEGPCRLAAVAQVHIFLAATTAPCRGSLASCFLVDSCATSHQRRHTSYIGATGAMYERLVTGGTCMQADSRVPVSGTGVGGRGRGADTGGRQPAAHGAHARRRRRRVRRAGVRHRKGPQAGRQGDARRESQPNCSVLVLRADIS